MITIVWTENDLPLTYKKRYNFWRKNVKLDMLASFWLAMLGTCFGKKL